MARRADVFESDNGQVWSGQARPVTRQTLETGQRDMVDDTGRRQVQIKPTRYNVAIDGDYSEQPGLYCTVLGLVRRAWVTKMT